MPLNTSQCNAFNSFLFRRTPDWDRKLSKDRFPYSYTYQGLYKTATWDSFTGTVHTWDKIHVTRPDDNGCWDQVQIDACLGTPCDPSRYNLGWGSTRNTYPKFHRDYTTPPFCFDQLRDTEEAIGQLAAIVEGLKALPNEIWSDFFRLYALRTSDVIHIAGSALTTVTTTDSIFTNNCTRVNLGSAGNLPTSKLTMEYLNHHVGPLMYKGYFNQDFNIQGKFEIMTDFQTQQELANANPALTAMYTAADFAKGGKFYAYGVMAGVGNWMFKIDSAPLRFQHLGSGVLQRVFPWENVSATVGKKPRYATCYENAPYQMSHVYNRAARTNFMGETTPVNPDMKFNARALNGTWSWKNPDYFDYIDPNTGVKCSMNNDKKNKGYFLGEFEVGVKTEYPEIEMAIIHLREPQVVIDNPRCAAVPDTCTQSLTPYAAQCFDPES